MIWTVRVAPDAEVELEASARWYDQRAGLRTEFESIDEALYAIAEGPLRYPPLMNDSPYRKYVLRRFPYVVIYRLRVSYVEIMAFAHTRKRPGYWVRRQVEQDLEATSSYIAEHGSFADMVRDH